jgi:hypothetical protein
MHEASAVWMLAATTTPEGVEGKLLLDEVALRFQPAANRAPTTILLTDIRKVRRVKGSPILDVRLRTAAGPARYGFYFVRPPSLDPPDRLRPARPRTVRRRAAVQLMVTNPVKKEEIKRWVRAIRTAAAGARDRTDAG